MGGGALGPGRDALFTKGCSGLPLRPPMLSTRGTNRTLAEEVWRTKDVATFDWVAPPHWREDDVTAAAFLAPSHADQIPVKAPWHPDTRHIVEGNASAVANATNDNVSDLDLCTVTLDDGEATVMYYAWGDQQLGPTAMVLSMALVKGLTQEELLASYF